MEKREFEDGTIVKIDYENKKLFVNCSKNGNFIINGFLSNSQIETFVNFGDFSDGKDNDFFTMTGESVDLIWEYL